jgi:5-methylcytosine-specific restriction endonuclease McrA
MHNFFDDDGNELDAKYAVETLPGGFYLVVESRGGSTGGRPARNVHYSDALRAHITRMKAVGMVLVDVQIASQRVAKLPEADRQIEPDGYPLPLPLAKVTDPEELRLAIGRAAAAYGREGKSGGNPTKKLRLRMEWPGAAGMSPDDIAMLLAQSTGGTEPTADPNELPGRVKLARQRQRTRRKAGRSAPPKGQKTVPKVTETSDRFVRDPEIIAWVLEEAGGNCEKCGDPAPFRRDDGEPFLEVHHVRPLAEGGPDTTDNAAACCPNCHRQLHYDSGREKLRHDIIAKIIRLNDYPRRQ